VCFDDLDFIVTVGGELVLAHVAIQSLPSIDFNYRRLGCQPNVSLGPQPSREDPHRLTLSPEHSARSAPMALPFGLRNAAATVSHLVAQRTIPSPTNNEFMGMIEHVTESFHDLLAEELESHSGSNSSRGRHHPSRECFMTGTPEGHVESVHKGEATPINGLDDETEKETMAPCTNAGGTTESLTPRDRGSTTPARAGMCGARAPRRRRAGVRHGP